MSSARWAVGVALVLGCLPVAILQACGGSGGASASHDGDGGSDDGTIDGSGGGDGNGGDGTGGRGDGALGGDGGPCVPGCPASVTCGRYTDCAGHVLTCGMPCASGKSCITSGTSQSCQTPSCTGKCGEIAVDSCGVAVNCGGCPTGKTCVNNACVTQQPAGDAGGGGCGKLTCSPAAGVNLCGTVSDGCGNTKPCTCPMGEDCTGGVCTAPPPECTGNDGGTGSKCGTITNACGSGQVQCAGCTGNNKCDNGTCMACTPAACGSMNCGQVNNGCGPAVSCGTCGSGEKCTNGTCCTPQTCAEAQDAGMVTGCGPVDLGCGVQQACMTCGMGEVCRNNACCTPQTCAEAQDAGVVITGCDPVDLGCGVQKVCSACAAGQICRSNACCTPQTCAEATDAGLVTGCDPVDLGCGVQQSCAPCGNGETCQANKCVACTPKTCSDFGGTGCDHSDGCGKTLDCCTGGTTCMSGGLCCQPGDVVYQGSCCLPQCDPSLPAGPQATCGTVIYCGGAGSQ